MVEKKPEAPSDAELEEIHRATTPKLFASVAVRKQFSDPKKPQESAKPKD